MIDFTMESQEGKWTVEDLEPLTIFQRSKDSEPTMKTRGGSVSLVHGSHYTDREYGRDVVRFILGRVNARADR